MTTLDIILLSLLIPSIVSGIFKGFIKQVLGIASLVLGAWLSGKFNVPVSEWLTGILEPDEPRVVAIISYVLIFTVTIIVLNILSGLLTKLFSAAALGGLNRLLGAVFGAFKAFLIICLAVWLFDSLNEKWELVNKAFLKESPVYEYCKDFACRFYPYLAEQIRLLK